MPGLYAVRVPRVGSVSLWVAVAVLLLMGGLCAAAPLLTGLDPLATDTTARNLPPGSPGHLLGTDTLGHDLWTRLLYGGRTSLLVGVSAAAVTVLIGVALGVLAAQGPRWVDALITRVADTMLALPLLVVVLALSAVLGGSLAVVILAIAVTSWMPVALIARAELRSQQQRRYVRAARSLGLSPAQVLLRHALPGALPPVASIAAFEIGHAILTESTLSFLGLGVPPNRPAWGTLLESAQSHLLTGQWYTVAFPALAIVTTIIAVNVIASAMAPAQGPSLVSPPALRAEGLCVQSSKGTSLVDRVDLELHPGRTTALVGPSGAGKSLTLRALARLLPTGLRASGQVQVGGVDLLRVPSRRLRHLRGTTLGWIGQDATTSLNPTVPVSRHFTESLRAHPSGGWSRSSERDRGLAALQRVGLENPDQVWGAYPFELSGGQAQRVAIALATLGDPTIVLADEVTAELDPVSQGEVLQLLRAHADSGGAVLLVTHDLSAAARYADQTVVLEAGQVLERGPSRELLDAAATPLTRAWSQALTTPRAQSQAQVAQRRPADAGRIAVSCTGVGLTLHGQGRHTRALNDVDLEVLRGEALAVVGRSGSGKSTLVGVLAALERPDTGALSIDGIDVWQQSPSRIRAIRRTVGLLFQDALSSFDPRYTVRRVIGEGLRADSARTPAELLTQVGLDPTMLDRRPETLSGGQRQRVALARALAPEPTILLADEPTNGLDILAQDDLVELLARARQEQGLTVVLITHDLRVARQVTDRIVVLDRGKVVDGVATADLRRVTHPATQALRDASGPELPLACASGTSADLLRVAGTVTP